MDRRPRYDPIIDVLHAHPAIFNRTSNSLALDDVAYKAATADSRGQLVEATYYAQVIAMGAVQVPVAGARQFVFCKGYQCVSSPEENPLRMQPLVWEATPRPARNKKPKVTTVLGHFFILDLQALQRQVCIVPNFKMGDGHFFLNPLVHEAEAHLACVRDSH